MDVTPFPPSGSRILYVITKATWGGAQKYVFDLATAARDRGWEIAVAYGTRGELATRLEDVGIRTIPIRGMGRDVALGADLDAFRSLSAILRDERPSVIHINSSKAGALGTLAARRAGVPRIVFTAHAWAFNEARPLWQKLVFKAIHAFTVLLAHTTICVSESTRRDMMWLPGAARSLVVIRNGVRETSYRTRADARQALWPDATEGTWIGMLSELHPTKRVDDAIDAVAALRETTPSLRLVVLGEGEERTRLEARIKDEGLEDMIRLAGFVPDGASYLKAFDLFLHTSRTDALAYAVIEAGRAGLPVVATRVGGIPEVVQHGTSGVLVAPGRPDLLADALAGLIARPEQAAALGHALQERIETEFSMKRMVEDTLAQYRR